MPEPMPTFTSRLRRTEESAARAREVVTELLAAWDLSPLADDAALIVTELVANAVAHGRGPSIRLTVTCPEQKLVRLAVTDNSLGKPQVTESGPHDESGRGLQIVAALSQRWGVDFRPRHKHVWAEVTQ
jgi:two-component sensor histidine kinase